MVCGRRSSAHCAHVLHILCTAYAQPLRAGAACEEPGGDHAPGCPSVPHQPHPPPDLDAQEPGGAAVLQCDLQMAAAADEGCQSVCLTICPSQGGDTPFPDFEPQLLRGEVFSRDVAE